MIRVHTRRAASTGGVRIEMVCETDWSVPADRLVTPDSFLIWYARWILSGEFAQTAPNAIERRNQGGSERSCCDQWMTLACNTTRPGAGRDHADVVQTLE